MDFLKKAHSDAHPLPKRYRFVGTHPQGIERVDFHCFRRGVVHARFGGESVWGIWGSSTMPHPYKIHAYYTWGLAGEDSKENRPKGPNQKTRKSQTHQQQAFPQRPCQKHGGRTCRKGGQHNKHNPTHTHQDKHKPKQPHTM